MINRLKNVIVSPKNEWGAIESEETAHGKLFMNYVLPLSLIPVVAAFIGFGLIGYSAFGVRFHSIEWGVRQAIAQWVSIVVGIYVTAFVIDFLAGNFGATKNFNKAFSLVAHSYTPVFLGGIFYILPSLSWLAFIPGIYGLYLLYTGLQPMMKVPAEKKNVYFIASLITMIVVMAILSAIMSAILLRGFGMHRSMF